MSIVVSSTTDSQEAVNAAAGLTVSGADALVESTEETAAEPKSPKDPPEEPVDPDEDEDEDGDKQDQEEDSQQPPAPTKRKGGYLRKIEQLERERGYAARRIEELESALAGGRKPAGETQQPQGPKPKPAQDQYQSYEEYVEALTDWKMEQRELQQAQQAKAWHAQEQERQRLAGWQERVGEFKQTAADFDEVLLQAEHIVLPPALQQALIESESGPALAYALARDLKELERIAKLPPLAAIRALGAFEARISEKEKPAPKPAAPPVSKAPPPVKAIANGSATTARKPLDEMDYQDYKRARERDLAAGRGRGY